MRYRRNSVRVASNGFVAPLFGFLELALSDQVTRRIRKVLEVRAGGTDQEVCFGGTLSRDFIRARVTAMVPEVRAEIAHYGIDKARLVAREESDSTRFWQAITPCATEVASSPACSERLGSRYGLEKNSTQLSTIYSQSNCLAASVSHDMSQRKPPDFACNSAALRSRNPYIRLVPMAPRSPRRTMPCRGNIQRAY